MNVTWQWKTFEQLTSEQLCQMLQLRQQVFVVEQQCCYADIDGWDQAASHLLATTVVSDSEELTVQSPHRSQQNTVVPHGCQQLIAYCRIFAPGVQCPEASIGRIVTSPAVRGEGLGHELVRRSQARCAECFPNAPVRIAAQAHLQSFYAGHGFVTEGAEYLEDDIPHVNMFLQPETC